MIMQFHLLRGCLALCLVFWGSNATQSEASRRYLSDTPGSAYEWLENQQKPSQGKACSPPSVEDVMRIVKSLPKKEGWEEPDDILRQIRLDKLTLPTRCENIAAYFLMNRLALEVGPLASKLAKRPLEEIVWGTLPLREVNAAAQRVNGQYIVVTSDALFGFLYGMLVTVNRTIAIESVEGQVRIGFSDADFTKQLQTHPDIVNRFADLVIAFALGRRPPDIKMATSLEAPLAIRQLNAIETMIVAHEFGHVVRGDADRGLRLAVALDDGRPVARVPSFGRDWVQELKADEIGWQVASEIIEKQKEQISLFFAASIYSIPLFFQLMESLDDATFCRGSGEGATRSLSSDQRQQARTEIEASMMKEIPARVSDNLAGMLGCRQNGHPPAWVRRDLALERVERFARERGLDKQNIEFARALLENAVRVGELAAPLISKSLNK